MTERSSRKVKIFVKPANSWGIAQPRYPLSVPLAIQRSHRRASPLWQKCYRGLLRLCAPALSRRRSFRLCLDRVRELSASIRGSVLVFQGVGESHYKCLPESERENFNHAVFTFAFFSRRQDRELFGAISRGLLDCPCRV
jgi:hypothetical protein